MKILTKKILPTLVISLCLLGTAIGINKNFFAKAQSIYDEMDILFQSTLTEILEYENSDSINIAAEKELLYDIDLNTLGVIYTFNYGNQECFAIIIQTDKPTVTEISLENANPYENNNMEKIYVSLGTYWQYDSADYYDCSSGLAVSVEALDSIREKAYFGALDLLYDTETVNYTYRTENKYNILSSIPSYAYGLANGCVPVAATNLIAYYDKTYTNLMPNYDPGSSFLGVYRYKGASSTTNALAETLQADMATNSTTNGTTITQFKSGLKKYVERNGYSLSYQSIMSWGKIDYSAAKSNFQNSKAMLLFLGGFRSTVITNANGQDVLNYEYSYQNHAATGFGALEVIYTLSNGTNRTDSYIHCAMGVGMQRSAYINIATNKIDDAIVVNIS